MRKVVLCLFYALCAFAIAFSLFWMALPRLALPSPAPGADSAAETPVPSGPSLAAQTLPDTGQPTQYLLRDEGGMVAVYTCGPDGSPIHHLQVLTAQQYYKIPLYSSNVLSVARTDRFTGYVVSDGQTVFNNETLKNLVQVTGE